MKSLKPRDKVTQRMTRAGLTLDNQTTGESMNISSREAEPEYTAKPGGTAEKALERAVDIRDRHKAKQAARHGERMAKEASGPASRLQFTAEERASPELAPYIKQAEKRADRLDAAKSALPQKRVMPRQPSTTRPRERPEANFTLRKWRNIRQSSNPIRPAVRCRRRGYTSTEKSMRWSRKMWVWRAAIRRKNWPSAKRARL